MASEKCPKCGSEMKHTTSLDGDSFWCQDCRIAELESLLRASEARERELRGKLEDAKAELREERNKPCNGCGL